MPDIKVTCKDCNGSGVFSYEQMVEEPHPFGRRFGTKKSWFIRTVPCENCNGKGEYYVDATHLKKR